MRLLSRYLVRTLAAPFLFALVALTSMLLLNQIAKRFGDLVGKGLPASVITEVLLLYLPFIVALTLPMAVLVAVLYAFSHLAADNEITAMRASGVSVAQMLAPTLAAGLLAAALNFVFIDQVLPRSNARLSDLQVDIGRKKPTLTMREQAINPVPPTNYFIRASVIEQGTGRMRDVTIYDLSLPTTRRVVYADSGQMAFEASGRDLQLHLFSGTVHEYRREEVGTVRFTNFRENIIRARNVADSLERTQGQFERSDRELSSCEMMDRRHLQEETARRIRLVRDQFVRRDLRSILRLAPEPELSFPEPVAASHCALWRPVERFLGRFIFPPKVEAQSPVSGRFLQPLDSLTPIPAGSGQVAPVVLSGLSAIAEAGANLRGAARQANSLGVEIHKKFTISVACFNFVLIGLALALRFPRGGIGLVLGGSMVIFAVFYIIMTVGEQLADRGYLSPAVAMWTPNVMIGLVGLIGLRAASRTAGTTRGGDLADLAEVLFGWLRFRSRSRAGA